MRWLFPFCCCLSLGLATVDDGRADDLLPLDLAPEQAIDQSIDAKLQQVGVSAAPATDDANFLRRVMLDLVGRPPTAAQAKAFLADSDTGKRTKLVDQLIESPAFVRNQVTEFDAWLMDGTKRSIREYLDKAFREKRTWDRMFRDMIVGEPDDSQQQGAIRFVAARAKDPDRLASDTSIAFFGVNITCAKCHDHPLVADWQQDHYYGMLSFFSRTYDAGEFLGERDYGQVSFKTVLGESREARPMFLTGTVVDEPPSPEPDDNARKEERKQIEELKKKKEPPPPPGYSRRAVLVETALREQESAFFARSIVNQIWNRFFGRGLVMPVDQMHSENPPSHPELLAWLSRDVRAHGYDLTRLIRGIVLSRAYARTSRWDSAAPRPTDDLFAVAQVRPLKPWQYATLLKLAAMSPDELRLDLAPDELDRRLSNLENSGREFGKMFDLPNGDFQVGVGEALLLSNSEKTAADLLADNPATLVGRLGQCGQGEEAAELAIWNVFARAPDTGEVEAMKSFLAERADRSVQGRQQLVWALLTSSECRFNY
jgi:hypothetical protein